MEGLKYISERKVIMLPLLLLALISTFVMNFNVLVPVYAQQNMNQNATGYGFLMTCMGIGSFIGAMTIAATSRSGPRFVYLVGGAFGMSLFQVVLGFEKSYELACFTLFAIGFCSIIFTALVNSTIQLNSADNMRGRVMSVYSLVFGGVTPIGSLYAGKLTELAGAPVCMMISGLIGVASVACIMLLMRKVKKFKSLTD